MTIDLLQIKHQMAAILYLFFNETLKVTTSFRNEFSIENHVEMRYYIKIYVKLVRGKNWNIHLNPSKKLVVEIIAFLSTLASLETDSG